MHPSSDQLTTDDRAWYESLCLDNGVTPDPAITARASVTLHDDPANPPTVKGHDPACPTHGSRP